MSTRRAIQTAVLLAALFAAVPALADGPFPREDLPPDLLPWVPWALDGVPDHACAHVEGEPVCLWPGELSLDLYATGGRFALAATADREIAVALPGDEAHWPQDVTVGGRPAAVLDIGDRPAVRLPAGSSRIAGEIRWKELPEGIRIPPGVAIVSLTVEGEPVAFPRRDDDGLLWLQSAASQEQEGDRLDVEVFRKISDGVPIVVTTRLVLRASGKSREASLGPVLLPGTATLSVDADVPARVDADGSLRVQVRAGTHSVEVAARTEGSPEALSCPAREAPWPAEEVWVWEADEELRQVALSGASGVDPSRTNLPEEWRSLPAFLLRPGDSLALETTRRGEPEPAPDRIRIDREIWMDLTGEGYTIRDRLSGELGRSWRLDLAAPGVLGHAAVDGVDQLVTEDPESKRPGVELRSGDLDAVAEWRIEGDARTLPAVGWSESVHELGATLHLPPGWTLLSAEGVDELPGTWWDQWDLFGFFFVLLVSLAVGRLTRWYLGLVALVTLVLTHNEPDAPFAVWIALLVSLALVKALPSGKTGIAARVLWWISFVWLAIEVVPFTVTQVRTGLFPQIEEDGAAFDATTLTYMADQISAPQMETAITEEPVPPQDYFVGGGEKDEEPLEGEESKYEKRKKIVAKEIEQQLVDLAVSGKMDIRSSLPAAQVALDGRTKWKRGRRALQQDPKAVVQTGPGVPAWSWRSWSLGWSGPVDRDHEIRLYVISPAANLALSLLEVLLVFGLSLCVVVEAFRSIRRTGRGPGGPPKDETAIAAGAAALLALSLIPRGAAAGEPPSQEILADLQARLTRPPECRPDCISTSSLGIAIREGAIRMTAEVSAGEDTGWRIPGPARNWVPARVLVDGRTTSAIALRDDGFLHVRVQAGPHAIAVEGQAPPGDAMTLEIGGEPHWTEVDAPGWIVDGLREDGRAEGSIQLSRAGISPEEGEGAAPVEEGSYPPWLEVERTLDLGIPWLVHTSVRRISPTGSPVVARVPLLPGESVTESDLQVEDGSAVITLGRDDAAMSWSSTLEESPTLALSAPEGRPWSEIWVLRCSPVWRCSFEGLTPVRHQADGRLEPTFRPWPGESISLELTRPEGVEGQSVTVDSARLEVAPGIRLVSAGLHLEVRSSRGGVQEIALPAEASLQKLTVDGAEQPYRQEGGRVEITLRPGSQRISLEWQQPGGITSLHQVPEVILGGPAANATVAVELPGDRWLVWAGGPSWGPAILFWGYLVTILILGLVLGRAPLSPLRSWQWMLLAFGLTQVPVPVSIVIVGWFFALAWRERRPPAHFVVHNALQVAIGVWTAAALGCLLAAVYQGLAVQPDMQVAGGGSTGTELVWYVDRVDGALPRPWIASLPILAWKVAMLLWSLWLAWSLVQWARWGWRAFSEGVRWRPIPRLPVPHPPAPAREEPKRPDEG